MSRVGTDADESPAHYKLSVKLGECEFSAEGPEATVMKQYRMFLEAVVGRGASAGKHSPAVDAKTERIFHLDEKGMVYLSILPQTTDQAADALLLLIYGFMTVVNEDPVPVGKVLQAARRSGLRIQRVDRGLGSHKGLYEKGGARKGSKYRLNRDGMAYAKALVATMLE